MTLLDGFWASDCIDTNNETDIILSVGRLIAAKLCYIGEADLCKIKQQTQELNLCTRNLSVLSPL